MDEFVEWYCSEPRLSFSRTVVLRYRVHLESRHLAPGTINLRLEAVRRLAYEAADCGLLSPAAGHKLDRLHFTCCRAPWRLIARRSVIEDLMGIERSVKFGGARKNLHANAYSFWRIRLSY